MKNYGPAEWLGVKVEIEFWRFIFRVVGIDDDFVVAVLDYYLKMFGWMEMVERGNKFALRVNQNGSVELKFVWGESLFGTITLIHIVMLTDFKPQALI